MGGPQFTKSKKAKNSPTGASVFECEKSKSLEFKGIGGSFGELRRTAKKFATIARTPGFRDILAGRLNPSHNRFCTLLKTRSLLPKRSPPERLAPPKGASGRRSVSRTKPRPTEEFTDAILQRSHPPSYRITALACQFSGNCGYWPASSSVKARFSRMVKRIQPRQCGQRPANPVSFHQAWTRGSWTTRP